MPTLTTMEPVVRMGHRRFLPHPRHGFIVIAVAAGGTGLMLPASLGAVAALITVAALGVVVHRPLARVPENTLKFFAGTLLSAFGTFWVGEGMRLAWPFDDWSLLGLIAAFWITAAASVALCRRLAQPRVPDGRTA